MPRVKIDAFVHADIKSFCIMVDSGEGQVRVARKGRGINRARAVSYTHLTLPTIYSV